jgi:hypothetical protein
MSKLPIALPVESTNVRRRTWQNQLLGANPPTTVYVMGVIT